MTIRINLNQSFSNMNKNRNIKIENRISNDFKCEKSFYDWVKTIEIEGNDNEILKHLKTIFKQYKATTTETMKDGILNIGL